MKISLSIVFNKIINFIEKYSLPMAIVLLAGYLLPTLILGSNATILVHDNLDSEVVYRVLLGITHTALNFSQSATITNVMGGIPRACFASGINFTVWLFAYLKPIIAYLINDTLVHLVAFFGMHLLLTRQILKGSKSNIIAAGVALCFAILPYYSIYGIVIAGQPLLLYAFFNILSGKKSFWDYLIIVLFPLFSSLYYGVFIVAALGTIFIIDWIKNRKPNFPYLIALLILTVLYLAVDFQLFYQIFIGNNYVSHRIEWNPALDSSPTRALFDNIMLNFLSGQYHAVSLPRYIIYLAVPLALIASFIKKQSTKLILVLLLAQIAISVFFGFYSWEGFVALKEKITLLKIFQFDRFYFLQATIWYIIFALALMAIAKIKIKTFEVGKLIVFAILIVQLHFIFFSNVERVQDFVNLKRIYRHQPITSMTFKRFFSEDLMKQVADYIGKPKVQYRIVNIGLEPSIAQYNGFYTLDGYQNNYPLAYKHQFRRIIAKELDKSEARRQYFDYWGSRCYVFIAETPNAQGEIDNIELDTSVLRQMGDQYIFSGVKIANPESTGLTFIKEFTSYSSPWKIYLYKVL